jgi:3-phosphoshikimate 1-carboxyvinyltransferase
LSLRGAFSPPGDKSISHRFALISVLAEGECRITNCAPGADVRSSLDAVSLLGCEVRYDAETVTVRGARGITRNEALIDCGNSGTTMRLIMGVLAGIQGEFVLDGDESLRKRPMERVAVPLRKMGAQVQSTDGKCPVRIHGDRLSGITYELPVASAQLKSAVLLAGMRADGKTLVKELIPSRDHTERLIRLFGGTISWSDGIVQVERSDLVFPPSFFIPGDPSSAAFFLSAAAIMPGSEVTAEGVLLNPTRTGFVQVLKRMGASLDITPAQEAAEPWGAVTARFSRQLNGCEVQAEEIPALVDEVPILALVATQATGRTVFHGVRELRVKESDRLAAIASQLGLMGAKILADDDSLTIEGPTALKSVSRLDSFGDHRIAMTLRLAGVLADSDPWIEGESSVNISYPGFHDTLKGLSR